MSAYVQTYTDFHLCALDPEQHERTCNYWYTARTYGGTPHTAFTTRAQALRWLERLGLSIDGELPEAGTHAVFQVSGTYRRASHLDPVEFDRIEGRPVLCLDNARYTLGKITHDADGIRTLHHLNCNVTRPEFDYWQASIAERWEIPAERAKELQHLASQWPHWGNLSKFMTEGEKQQIDALWSVASDLNGNLSRASIVARIARGVDPITGESRP